MNKAWAFKISLCAALLLSSTITAFALPQCVGPPYFNGILKKVWQWDRCYGEHKYKSFGKIKEAYAGEWESGEWHGIGTYTNTNGTQYIGEFRYGRYDGQGILTYKGMVKKEGVFKWGNFLYNEKTPYSAK